MKRRTLLVSGLGLAGALVVGWAALPQRSRTGARDLMPRTGEDVALNGWIKITPEGGAVLAMPRSEMGQGIHTALAMLAAEELELPLSAVRIEQAGFDTIYGNVAMLVASLPFHPRDMEEGRRPLKVALGEWLVGKVARELGINATGGSSSVADAWEPVRLAAATAKASLMGAASLQWKLPLEDLRVRAGTISHASGASARYGELARFAAATPPGEVRLKDRKDWRIIGQPVPRTDVPAKVDGSARFGIDTRLPGMLFASVRMCPMLGGSPGRVDPAPALALPGVRRVVQLAAYGGGTAGVAVVGDTWWQADRGAAALDIPWQQRPLGALDTREIAAALREAARKGGGHVFHEEGETPSHDAPAALKVTAVYEAPYLAHAALEPINCTARVAEGRVEVWAPTQVPGLARAAAAQVAGVPESQVDVHVTYLGGGFGRRLEVDFVGQAVRVAMDCGGAPVQLVWPRAEDTRHDFYRPMHVARMTATVDGAGKPATLRIDSAGDAISPRWMERAIPALAGPVDAPDKTAADGLYNLPYAFPNQRIAHAATRMGVPVGFWRSVGHSHNAFFSEGLVDELAHAVRKEPAAFRRELLASSPRHLAVLELAVQKAGWTDRREPGRALGIALHESFGSIVGQVAEVSVEEGRPRVHRVVCAVDCGTVVNPAIVRQQMESAVVFGLSAALGGRVDIQGGVVKQSNLHDHDHPLLRLRHAPLVQTWIVPSERPPAGVGEPGVPGVAPAVANALFVLTGKRHRTLPLI